MILLFSHQLTESQKNDARENWSIDEFVSLTKELQKIWSNIDPELESLEEILLPIRHYVKEQTSKDDVVLIQGDFGACCNMAQFVKEKGMTPVYATTKRSVEEYREERKNIKKSIFEHRRFRKYE